MEKEPETSAEVADPQTPDPTTNVDTATKPDFDALGKEFNAKIADVLMEYDNKIPYIYMAKILANLGVDLMAQQNALQSQYIMEQVVAVAKSNSEQATKEAMTTKSRIIKV